MMLKNLLKKNNVEKIDKDLIICQLQNENALLKEELKKKQDKETKDLKEFTNAKEELQNTSQLKSKFIAILTHELKSPLYSVKNLLYLMQEDYVSKKEIGHFANELEKITDSALSTLENLLNWTMEQMIAEKTNATVFNLSEVVDDVFKFLNSRAVSKNILTVNLINNQIKVLADINQVKFIIRNLVSNALKFTDALGRINIYCIEAENNMVEVSVSDTGIGISENAQKRLFNIDDKYSTKGTQGEKGTGLGLILCKDFILKNDGELKIKSQEGIGSTFSFTLKHSK